MSFYIYCMEMSEAALLLLILKSILKSNLNFEIQEFDSPQCENTYVQGGRTVNKLLIIFIELDPAICQFGTSDLPLLVTNLLCELGCCSQTGLV